MLDWKLAYAENYRCRDLEITCINDIKKYSLKTVDAKVPGNFELDLMREGIIENLYYSTNTLKAQELENLHLWYFTTVELDTIKSFIRFEGIDTISDIYVNGVKAASTDNMFLSYDIYPTLKKGKNEMLVHIKPVCIEARNYSSPSSCFAQNYNYPSLYIRKASYMFGWDIMPRIVSAGLWKEVKILPIEENKLNEVFFATSEINEAENKAKLLLYINADLAGDFATDYTIEIEGKCKDSTFKTSSQLWHNSCHISVDVENCKVWWPKNYGEPNLYDTTVRLCYKGRICDEVSLKVGIRTVKLIRRDPGCKKADGAFCFEINKKTIASASFEAQV